MPEIGTSGLMSGEGKRSDAHKAQATAPLLDSTGTHGISPFYGSRLTLRLAGMTI